MRAILAAIAIASAFLLAGCSTATEPPPGEADYLREALVELVRAEPAGGRIRLSQAWPGDWDRAAVLGPYSYNDDAREILGFDFDFEAASPWINTEGGNVVVLASGEAASAWFKVPSREVALYCMPSLVERVADEFTVHHDTNGFVGLGPEDGSGCI